MIGTNESPFLSFRKYLIITRKLIVNITKPNTKIATPAQKYKFPSLPRLTPIPLLVSVTSTTPMENQAGDITPRIAIHIRAIKVRNPRFEKVHIEKPSFFIFLYFMVAVYCHFFSLLLKRVMIMEKKTAKDTTNIIYEIKLGSQDAMEKALETFEPIISKYSFWLKDEDARQELSLFLIEQIKNYPLESFRCDAAFIQYISRSIYHEYIRLSKHQQKQKENVLSFDEQLQIPCSDEENIERRILIYDLLSRLSKKQREIIVLEYFYGYKDREIGNKLNISRQAVNKEKNSALKKLRLFMAS